ncbi:MAG: hypothetical protein H6741_25400 [Alphaproteobacteria bacterium]|nr:hypothetical protein [Alphaproteobacteria bacterium]
MSHAGAEDSRDRTALVGGLAVVVLIMVLPMLLIGEVTGPDTDPSGAGATGAAAALGVIFRASARNILRSTFMMGVRATSRTVTRRVARGLLRSFMGLILPMLNLDPSDQVQRRKAPGWFSIALGYAALALSFGGVLALVEPEAYAALTLGGSPVLAALIAATPLLVHAALMRIIAPRMGLEVEQETSIDALLLQAYFTGAASFLPLASDVLLSGPRRAKAVCSATVLLSLLSLHFLLSALNMAMPTVAGQLLAAMFLLYAFVFVFPFKPLDGGDVWAESRWAWLVLAVVVGACFMTRLPEVWVDVL